MENLKLSTAALAIYLVNALYHHERRLRRRGGEGIHGAVPFSIETEAAFGQLIERTPEQAIDRNHKDRHDSNPEHDAGIVASIGRLCDKRPEASSLYPGIAP